MSVAVASSASATRITASAAAGSAVRVTIARSAGERFFGFGERSDAVGRAEGCVENWVGEGPYQLADYGLVAAITPRWAFRQRRDATYYPVPWVLSSRGYGVLIDSPEFSRVHLLAGRWAVEIEADRLLLRLFLATDAAAALAAFSDATGRQPFPAAAWCLGPWVQTGHDDLVPFEREAEIVAALRAADAPVSAIETHMRRLPGGAHEGRRDAERRRTRLFHDAGLASLTYLNPFVAEDYRDRFGEAEPLLQRRSDGSAYTFDAYIGGREPPLAREGQLDFSNPESTEFFSVLAREAMEDGHDGWMEDFGEYTPPDALLHDGTRGEAAHNHYPVAYHAAGAAAAAPAGRPIARFGRSGWTGAAPLLPLVWGGDPTTTWGFDGLASALVEGLSAGLSGIGLWGCDIGGFFSLGEDQLDVELLVRWIQLGALVPLMRTKAEGIAIPPRPRPQVWDAEVLPHWRRWAKLHTQLSPYLLGAAAQYVETGMPLMRHHVLTDPSLGDVDDQYMLGDWLLVAPVLAAGQRRRQVVVPGGRWIDAWRSLAYDARTGGLVMEGAAVLEGPSAAELAAPLGEIPVLIRKGALLPLLPPDVWSLASDGDGARLHLLAYPSGQSQVRFGREGRIHSHLQPGEWGLDIEGAAPAEVTVQACLDFTPASASAPWTFDGATGVIRTAFAGRSLRVSA